MDHKREHQTPPLARVMGVGRQHNTTRAFFLIYRKHTHATRVQCTTLYSDGTTHSKQHRSKGVQPNGSPCVNSHCSTQYEQCCYRPTFQEQSLSSSQTTSRDAKPTQHEEILNRLTCYTLAQLRTSKSPFLKLYFTKSTPNHIHHHYAPSNTLTHDTHHLFNCSHIRTTLSPLDLWTYLVGVTALLARWTEKLAGGPQTGTSAPPLVRIMGVGRQQQHVLIKT